MPNYRKSRYTNKSKKNKTKSKRQRTYKKYRGGCGCGQRVLGGSVYLSSVPQYAYYPYNSDLNNDPSTNANIGDARFMGDYSRVSGGRRRKGRKIKGGSNFFSNLYTQLANSGSGMNYINSFGAVNGGVNQSALISGTSGVVNGAVTSQPVIEQPYGFHNQPLA